MKASTILLGFVAVASANLVQRQGSSTASVAPTTTSVSLSPTATCLAACPAGDVNCQAACVGTAHPNSAQASQTNDCAAKCVQGNGTTAESLAYAQCIQSCISSYFPTSQTVGAAVGGSTVASGSATGTAAAGTGSKTASSGSTATGSAATVATGSSTGTAAPSSTSKAAAANNVARVVSIGGFAGLLMAIFAL
ncbi:hypothetical protein B0J14DRAFT_702380 [Halenospora varia]|nr:hypothetical protein B0J14DRAFT_702380 [Halenospora varia]